MASSSLRISSAQLECLQWLIMYKTYYKNLFNFSTKTGLLFSDTGEFLSIRKMAIAIDGVSEVQITDTNWLFPLQGRIFVKMFWITV